jgi:hypothetical protein
VALQGILFQFHNGALVQVCQLFEEDYTLDTESINPVKEFSLEIQHLLSYYAEVFADKLTFPPPMGC